MSLLSWLFPRKSATASPPESSGLAREEATRPVNSIKTPSLRGSGNGSEHAGNRKNERMARRELLYSVVRESMMRAGVLSQSYKFKVLSLDQRGRQFLVMMDLASEFGGETHRLAEIEAMIAQGAKARYDIVVTSVYWRMNEHVAVGVPSARASSPMPLESQPMPLPSRPAPLVAGTASHAGAASHTGAAPATVHASATTHSAPSHRVERPPRFEPIQEDEVAAFKRALAAGLPSALTTAANASTAEPAKPAAALRPAAVKPKAQPKPEQAADDRHHRPSSYALLTGYEDTEMPESDTRAPALSATQYGDLN